MINKQTTLQINDIFESISGEAGGFPQGTWVTIVRLQGCNLRCSWCDTPQGQRETVNLTKQGTEQSILEIMLQVKEYKNKHVMITGGEPLYQQGVIELIQELQDQNYKVQVETNGSLPLPIMPKVHWVVDYKCPSSHMEDWMLPLNALSSLLGALQRIQEQCKKGSCSLKFVVKDDEDMEYALNVIDFLIKDGLIIPFLISPIDADGTKIPKLVQQAKDKNRRLIDFITFSVQLHKILNLP